ncbi:hypothetical protein, conserved [Eimeria tenella]|uniref:Replication factor-A C terminal domain-containing protein n=1 Tax=Eimeria tenella TaxID=5802 RepID=U6KL93_EIMTE|nr:hypothetical protein, conserved [Eimeria tenella]CDJ37032.1 hypothetical protein, conserved [Eimeria tenella]|eukprot:XP_013227870.1 hypothetical protein, conserved [Eimeria tenella]
MPTLSVGFWDAFASGSMWPGPVLAVVSFSAVGKDHILVLAADGSVAASDAEEDAGRRANGVAGVTTGKTYAQPTLTAGKEQPVGLQYQYGRLLMREDAVPCRPELLVNRFIALTVYSKCRVKGRLTPVVADVELLPGRWNRQGGLLVVHSLYTAEADGKETLNAKRTITSTNDPTDTELRAASGSKRVKLRGESGEQQKEPNSSTVYARSRNGPVAKVQRGVRTTIRDLHLYSHHWELLARISYKSEVKGFANAKGESSLFTVHLIDAQATEIRATFFGRAAVTWYPRLHTGRVYTFSRGSLQRASRSHTSLTHEVQIKFDSSAAIEEADDDLSIPFQKFDRVLLADLSNQPAGTVVDVLVFVVEAKEPQTILSRVKNQELVRRDLTLVDSSGVFVSLSLFGPQALQLSQVALTNTPLAAIKGAKVSEYAGQCCLASSSQMNMTWFPTQPAEVGEEFADGELAAASGVQREALKGERQWWRTSGKIAALHHLSKCSKALGPQPPGSGQTLLEIENAAKELETEDLGTSKTFTTACPECKRKVQKELPTATVAAAYKCTNCRKAVIPQPRWMLSLKLIDAFGTLNCVALGDQGQDIMNVADVTAEGLCKLEAGGQDTRGRKFADILRQLAFSVGYSGLKGGLSCKAA